MIDNVPVFLGIDLGTSSLKVIAVGTDGGIRAGARRGYPTARPGPGAAEQDPAHWWAALRDALDELARTVSPGRWTGIGLSAMLPTLVELDAQNRPLAPAVTWEDARAEPEAERLCGTLGDDRLYRVTGQRVDGRYLAPMHARRARLGSAGATVAGAKDALFAELTGTLLTDPSTAAGYGVYGLDTGSWDAELVHAAAMPGLPAIAPAGTAVGLRPQWREPWELPEIPVVLGAADSVLGALGLGAERHGDVAVIAGTSAIVLGVCDAAVRDPHRRYLVTPLAGPGWGLEMDLLAVGSAFSMLAALLGFADPAELLAAAARVDPLAAPVFLPYLAPGEQGALWNPRLTGTLHGLRLDTGREHVARALLNGVITELRRCVGILAETTGRRGPLLLGGAAAVSPLLWQDLADATGRDVLVDAQIRDHSTLGAARFAAAALNAPLPATDNRELIRPREDAGASWEQIAARHDALRHRLS